jgi:hypothetical protein
MITETKEWFGMVIMCCKKASTLLTARRTYDWVRLCANDVYVVVCVVLFTSCLLLVYFLFTSCLLLVYFSKITISVRLFKRLPISVSFVAIGRDFPKPSV